ncbi:MAG TPA: GGDEF domain-containing protein [Gaiellales bacterium]|jgi:diguanylate cyclase (GGDEF)-like protein|nr:GGDEF domain-containing protein [Gaiellales bacterium]
MFAWSPRDLDGLARQDSYMRRGAMLSFEILRTHEREGLWPRVVKDVAEWLDATAVRGFDLDGDGRPVLTMGTGSRRLPAAAVEIERELMTRALERGRSLISNHPMLDDDLRLLADALHMTGSVVHAVLLRAYQRSVGVMAVHWIGVPRPGFERREGFFTYLENAALALALIQEREARQAELDDLHRTAYTDALTGLPNHRALERELEALAGSALALVVLDFDGMREANAAFKNDYALGGDVLIRAFSGGLGRMLRPGELAARLHTAGDEFCVLLPGCDQATAERRAGELEAALDRLEVPETHRHVYGGASVGAAAGRPDEPPAETLARASVAMHDRKAARRARRAAV